MFPRRRLTFPCDELWQDVQATILEHLHARAFFAPNRLPDFLYDRERGFDLQVYGSTPWHDLEVGTPTVLFSLPCRVDGYRQVYDSRRKAWLHQGYTTFLTFVLEVRAEVEVDRFPCSLHNLTLRLDCAADIKTQKVYLRDSPVLSFLPQQAVDALTGPHFVLYHHHPPHLCASLCACTTGSPLPLPPPRPPRPPPSQTMENEEGGTPCKPRTLLPLTSLSFLRRRSWGLGSDSLWLASCTFRGVVRRAEQQRLQGNGVAAGKKGGAADMDRRGMEVTFTLASHHTSLSSSSSSSSSSILSPFGVVISMLGVLLVVWLASRGWAVVESLRAVMSWEQT